MAVSQESLPAAAPVTSFGAGKRLLLLVVGLLAIYFALTQVVPYFVWSEAAYGYYWEFRLSLLLHVVGGLIALLSGLFQLWTGLNRKAMGTHPLTGRLYVTGVVVGAAGAFSLAFTSSVYGFAWGVGLSALAAAWLAVTGTAFYCIRKRRIEAHKQWMIRSYIVTFGFVTFRIVVDYAPYEALWGIPRPEMASAMIWTAWVVPLIGYEMLLAFRRS
jgi:uncharacterized membrane protein